MSKSQHVPVTSEYLNMRLIGDHTYIQTPLLPEEAPHLPAIPEYQKRNLVVGREGFRNGYLTSLGPSTSSLPWCSVGYAIDDRQITFSPTIVRKSLETGG